MNFKTLALAAALTTVTGLAAASDTIGGASKQQARVTPLASPKVVLTADFSTQATNVINFDSASAPSLFLSTTSLQSVGTVSFNGSSITALDGGAVLDQSSNFGVTGHSAPNFLAFNCETQMSDGGIPRLPEVVNFGAEVSKVSLKIGSGLDVGAKVTLYGIGSQGVERKSATLAAALSTVTFKKPLTHILMSAGACKFVVDDISFTN